MGKQSKQIRSVTLPRKRLKRSFQTKR